MIEIEKYPCNDNNEACSRERHFYELLNANMNIHCPTLNIEKGKKYQKEYMKKYVEEHKEHLSEKKACDVCGKLYVNKTNHNKTKFHTNVIKK